MRKTSLLKTIPLSFYSVPLYREAGREWQGMGFAYLLLVVALSLLAELMPPLTLAALEMPEITLTHPIDFEYLISQMPTLDLKGGELSIEGTEQHYYIHAREAFTPGIIIDTTRPVSDWDTKDFSGVVLGRTQFLIKSDHKNKDEAKLYHYPPDVNRTFTRDDVHGMLEVFLPWLWPLIGLVFLFTMPFIVGVFFAYRIVQMLLFGLFGMLMAMLTGVKLEYGAIVRLACVSATPLLLLEALAMPFGILIRWWVAFAIGMVYLFFAIKANAET